MARASDSSVTGETQPTKVDSQLRHSHSRFSYSFLCSEGVCAHAEVCTTQRTLLSLQTGIRTQESGNALMGVTVQASQSLEVGELGCGDSSFSTSFLSVFSVCISDIVLCCWACQSAEG